MKYFLFLDGEMTGLDPSSDAILELAWFITDENFEIVSTPQSYPVNVDEGTTIASLSAMNDYVRDMHTTSGLLHDIEDGATLDFIFRELAGDIDDIVGPDDTVHIVGLSIHFDVDFLKANDFDSLFRDFYPQRSPHIHHKRLDLSSVKLLFSTIPGLTEHIGNADNPGAHRALNDCYEALGYARLVRGTLGLAFPFKPVGADTAVAITADDAALAELDDDVVTIDLTKYEGNL